MCAATSETLRFSSTITRTFSTPVAGGAECKPGGEPDGRAGTRGAPTPEQALTPRSTIATATAATASCHDRAHPFTALFVVETCTGCDLPFALETRSD